MMFHISIDWAHVPGIRFGKHDGWIAHIRDRARRPDSVLRVELNNLMANIRADEAKLDAMTIDPGDCCHSCVWGDAWWKVYDRLKRRLDRANQLTKKLWYDAGNYGPVRPVWSSHV